MHGANSPTAGATPKGRLQPMWKVISFPKAKPVMRSEDAPAGIIFADGVHYS